jgi:hypothetical protein
MMMTTIALMLLLEAAAHPGQQQPGAPRSWLPRQACPAVPRRRVAARDSQRPTTPVPSAEAPAALTSLARVQLVLPGNLSHRLNQAAVSATIMGLLRGACENSV